jgi:PAS domain S-box-containing protein
VTSGPRQPVGVTTSARLTLVSGTGISLVLLLAGEHDYPNLHTALDMACCLLSGVLALLLWDIGRRTPLLIASLLALCFTAGFVAELLHVAVAFDWFGRLEWITLGRLDFRPALWPVALHLLCLGTLAALWVRNMDEGGLRMFGAGLLLAAALMIWLFLEVPRYTAPGFLGITRPSLLAVPLCWVVVAIICWRRRRMDRLYPMLVLMSATLVAANLLMLYSRSPPDAAAMASHLLTIAAFLSLVFMKFSAATHDTRARVVAEQALIRLNAELEQRVASRTAELQQAYDTTRSIVESALDGLIVMDGQGSIEHFSPAAEQIFGIQAGDAVGRPLADVIIPPEARALHREGMARHMATGTARILGRRIEVEGMRADGTRVPLELSVNRVSGEGPARFAGFVRDLTERHSAERRLAAQFSRLDLLNRISRAIGERQDLRSILHVTLARLEEDLPIDFGCVCLYDDVAERLTVCAVGARSQELARQTGLTEEVTLPIDRNGLARCVGGTLVYEPETLGSIHALPTRLFHGGLRSFVAAPLQAESRVFGVLIAARRDGQAFSSGDCEFLRQLSEHVALAANQAETHEALQRAYNDLRLTQQAVMQQERLRALGQMASGIAHDINNAISPVSLYVEALLEREPGVSESGRGYLKVIQRAMDDVVQTVARMREFYRVHPPTLELRAVDLNELLQQVLEITRARWSDMPQQRGIVIRPQLQLSERLPLVLGVESEIREALINLIFNAVDAMQLGGLLTLRTGVNESTREVYTEVCDTGLGMDDDTRRRCLEPFFTTKGERGTGLGLAMVYGTVQRHGAEISIDSTVGVGTTIRIAFSRRADAASGQPAFTGLVPVPRRMRLLLIDDDPLLLKSLRDILESDGHQVAATHGGKEGIEEFSAALARGEPFTAVLTDLGMPHMDGRQVARVLKSLSATTPIILLTGWGQRLIDDGEMPQHIDQVLSKPPKLRVLREALAKCMG